MRVSSVFDGKKSALSFAAEKERPRKRAPGAGGGCKGVRRRGQTACCLPSRHSLNGACFCAVKSCSCCARSTRAGGCSREKRHADGFGTFNFATLVFLLLAWHSPQAVSARAACVGCHQKYRESRDDVAGVLYLFSAKRYPKTPRQMPSPTSSRLTLAPGARLKGGF